MNKPKRNHKKSAFLQKTFQILQNQSFKDIISWNHDGIGFVIHDCHKFAQEILSTFFKHSNFNSFIRQLNMYGFSKKRASKSENYYHHQKFCKDQKSLIYDINRRSQKKNGKLNHKGSKMQSEFSIQLESHQDNHKKNEQQNNGNSQLSFQFYALMNFNHNILNSQFRIISEIIKDLKVLKLSGMNQHMIEIQGCNLRKKEQNHMEILSEYVRAQIQLRTQLLDKAKIQIKDSQKFIKSFGKVETEQSLNEQIQYIRNIQ